MPKVKTIDIRAEAEELSEWITDLRHHFHEYPELSLHETETSAYIADRLEAMDIPVRHLAGTGLTAEIGTRGPVIALRADMDALPIREQNNVPYASRRPGVMHACGHDAHMAGLLGAARILKRHEKELACRVRLLFQPSEENGRGARLMIDAGALTDVSRIFGLHVFADMPSGKVSIEPGPRMAVTDAFRITVRGKSGHAGKPHRCVDATVAACALVTALQTLVSRETDPTGTVVVTVGSLHSGTAYNIISGEAVLEGTIRSFYQEETDRIKEALRRVAENTAAAYRARADVEFKTDSHPAVTNDPEAVKSALRGARRVIPRGDLIEWPKLMLGEDFANYQMYVPGAFAFVGGGDAAADLNYPNHHERFNVTEETAVTAAMLHAAAALAFSEEQKDGGEV